MTVKLKSKTWIDRLLERLGWEREIEIPEGAVEMERRLRPYGIFRAKRSRLRKKVKSRY